MVRSLPSSTAVITILSRATIGEENPEGVDAFQSKFFSGPKLTGGFCSSAIPDPFGPRNRAQASGLSAARLENVMIPKDKRRINECMLRWRLEFGDRFVGDLCSHHAIPG